MLPASHLNETLIEQPSYAKDHLSRVSRITIITTDLKNTQKGHFGGDFLPSDWRKTELKEENPSVAKVSES